MKAGALSEGHWYYRVRPLSSCRNSLFMVNATMHSPQISVPPPSSPDRAPRLEPGPYFLVPIFIQK
jgi:hypothetical protein